MPMKLIAALPLAVVLLLNACSAPHGQTGRGAASVSPAPRAVLASVTSTAAPVSTASTGMARHTSAAATAAPPPAAAAPRSVPTTAAPVAAMATPGMQAVPVRVRIPAIGVSAPVELVGLIADGAMDVPKAWNDAGWYRYGPTPGQPRNAAIAGHLDSTTGPAIFWRLGILRPGDRVLVTLSTSQVVTFVVTAKASYRYDQAPLTRIFGAASTANLNLITCGGSWDAFTRNYSHRTVVYATKA